MIESDGSRFIRHAATYAPKLQLSLIQIRQARDSNHVIQISQGSMFPANSRVSPI
ncbi:hypothetical protein BDR05DRAFT_963564, partial [Suillus weaverae]